MDHRKSMKYYWHVGYGSLIRFDSNLGKYEVYDRYNKEWGYENGIEMMFENPMKPLWSIQKISEAKAFAKIIMYEIL